MRLSILTVLLAACGAPDPGSVPTSPLVGPACVEDAVPSVRGAVFDLHLSASGPLVSTGPAGVLSRSAAGVWSDLDGPRDALRAASFGARLWVASAAGDGDAVHYRDPDGLWVDAGFEGRATDLIALGTADVRALDLRSSDQALFTSTVSATLDEHRWDGEVWQTTAWELPSTATRSAAYLPDGRVLVVADEALWVSDGDSWQLVPSDGAIAGTPRVHVGPTGAIALTSGLGGFWSGDLDGVAWAAAAADVSIQAAVPLAPDDVWLAGGLFDAVLLHWDGAAATEVERHPRGGLYAIESLPGGEVVAGGGADGALVLRADAAGVVVERDAADTLSPGARLAVDDTTGAAWSLGRSALARTTGATWESLPIQGWTPDHLPVFAVSAGRLAHFDEPWLTVREPDGEVSVFEAPDDVVLHALCGVDGALFALGRQRVTDQPWGFVNTGAGWQAIGGLPADGVIQSCWADGTDDVWLGLASGGSGALAHWDGAGSVTLAGGLDGVPGRLARHGDGALRLVLGSGVGDGSLWTWDGAALSRALDLSGVRDAYRTADEAWFVLQRDEQDHQLRKQVDGDAWEDLARFDGLGGGVSLVGSGRQVWVQGGELRWSRTCGP